MVIRIIKDNFISYFVTFSLTSFEVSKSGNIWQVKGYESGVSASSHVLGEYSTIIAAQKAVEYIIKKAYVGYEPGIVDMPTEAEVS